MFYATLGVITAVRALKIDIDYDQPLSECFRQCLIAVVDSIPIPS